MSWMGWLRWVKNQIHAVGVEPQRPRRPAPEMQRNLHRLEALLEQGAGQHRFRQRSSGRPSRAPIAPAPAGSSGTPAWAAAAIAAHFAERPAPVPTQLVVIALDSSNQPVRDYTGTAHLSMDPAAARPGDYTFTAEDSGGHRFSVTLSTAGNQSISVTDAAPNAASGSRSE
jgi:hypothetical protein